MKSQHTSVVHPELLSWYINGIQWMYRAWTSPILDHAVFDELNKLLRVPR